MAAQGLGTRRKLVWLLHVFLEPKNTPCPLNKGRQKGDMKQPLLFSPQTPWICVKGGEFEPNGAVLKQNTKHASRIRSALQRGD